MTKVALIGLSAALGACNLYWGDAPSGPPDATTASDASGTTDAPAPPVYRLVQQRSLASPIPDPSGITFDGEKLWIIAGSPPSNTSTLVRFDPDHLTVDPSFTYDNLQQTLGSIVFGITWDGAAIWIAVAGDTNMLVRIDPTTGHVAQTMSSPTELGPVDLDFDGTDIWISTGIGEAHALDSTTGGVVRTLSFPDRDFGIAVRPGEAWIGSLFGGMTVVDPVSGAEIASVTHDDGTELAREEIGPSVFVGDQLVIVSQLGITYYDVVR